MDRWTEARQLPLHLRRHRRGTRTRPRRSRGRVLPSFAATPTSKPLVSTGFARRSTGAWTLSGQVYLDYTGGSLYAESQLADHLDLLRQQRARQPALDQPDLGGGNRVARARAHGGAALLRCVADEYSVIFTPNATGALKLVGEAYPFATGSRFLLTSDNHNSVNGIREFARAAGATTTYLPSTLPSLRVDDARLEAGLRTADARRANLFAYPAQSNFSGVQHPLEWIAAAQSAGWDVLVDCAAFVPTNRLDLSEWKPDFVPISLYKLLGYPTGVGCLLVRKQALARLRRPWFAGGTIATRQRSGRLARAGRRRAGVRGRHGQLPLTAGRRAGASLPRGSRHRHDPHPRPLPDRLAA